MKGKKTGGRVKGTPNKATADLKAYASQFTAESIDFLVAAMRNTTAPMMARITAANMLLDRGHGKPPQAMTLKGGSPAFTVVLRNLPIEP